MVYGIMQSLLAHESHQRVVKTNILLKESILFPWIDRASWKIFYITTILWFLPCY